METTTTRRQAPGVAYKVQEICKGLREHFDEIAWSAVKWSAAGRASTSGVLDGHYLYLWAFGRATYWCLTDRAEMRMDDTVYVAEPTDTPRDIARRIWASARLVQTVNGELEEGQRTTRSLQLEWKPNSVG